MSNWFIIENPGGAPLGEPEDVLARLTQAFPETAYELLTEEPPPEIAGGFNPWLDFICWLGSWPRMGYPQYQGFFGWAGGFQFLAKSPVMRIEAACFFDNPECVAKFEQLLADTGWISKPRKKLFGFLSPR